MEFLVLLFWLSVGHSVADYPLQNTFMATSKSSNLCVMVNHCVLHAGCTAAAVQLAGLSVSFALIAALFQFVTHFAIDGLKCAGSYDEKVDQLLHLCVAALIAISGGFWRSGYFIMACVLLAAFAFWFLAALILKEKGEE